MFFYLLLIASCFFTTGVEGSSTSKIKKEAAPYLIPASDPKKPILDALFENRPTRDIPHLKEAGFSIIAIRPRSFIVVAKHQQLPGYLFKLYTDNELRIKDSEPGWKWLIYRCRGREKIARVMQKKKIKLFALPWKGLYFLPSKGAPTGAGFDAKPLILIAEHMPLVPKADNLRFWKERITKEHLRELYQILKGAASIRSRPDNLHFMPDGKIAIIDTEYPKREPDFHSITRYLNAEMAAYWKKLTK